MKTEQQLHNLREALVWWQTVPEANVIEDLMDWREEWPAKPVSCNTVACFGGWCAVHPALMAQGVKPKANNGAPVIDTGGGSYAFGSEVAGTLFGEFRLFKARGDCPADDGFKGTDHELVTNRIRWALEHA